MVSKPTLQKVALTLRKETNLQTNSRVRNKPSLSKKEKKGNDSVGVPTVKVTSSLWLLPNALDNLTIPDVVYLARDYYATPNAKAMPKATSMGHAICDSG